LSEKNNQPHIAESTVLYYIDEVFNGDLTISLQAGPDFSHYVGKDIESDATVNAEKHVTN
jgi:hypothetical protein